MRFYILVLMIIIALLIQVTLLNFISIWGVKPDLVLIIVTFDAFLRGSREGALIGFLGGLFEDLAVGSYIGMNALSMMAAGYLAGLTESRLYKESSLIVAFLVWVSSFTAQLINYILLSMMEVYIAPGVAFFNVIMPTAAYTALLALLFYRRFLRSNNKGLLYTDKI
ncbi:MAG: rod shape-determining protein MreD [Peptococcaceae bacterium]|nr:rod shape-determining protein MreD [Peptococcaceae bacterium]